MLIILLCIAVPLVALYYFLSSNNDYWNKQGIPNEKPFLIFGSFFSTLTRKEHMFKFLDRIYNNFKSYPYVGVLSFNKPSLVIRSPELIKKILIKDFNKFVNRGLGVSEDVDPIAFHAMFTATDDFWKNIRIKISPVFTSGKMRLMMPLIQESVNDLLSFIQNNNGKDVEIKSLSKRFTVDVISSCALGINANCINKHENNKNFEMAEQMLNIDNFARSLAMFGFFFAPKILSLFRLPLLDPEGQKYFENIFKESYQDRKKLNIQRNDLIDLLHNLRDEGDNKNFQITNIQMTAQAVSFFTAGNDTTSVTFTYSLYELAQNEDIQNRLRNEINKSIETHGELTYESIHQIKYLDIVIHETLRKYPVVPFLNRECLENYKIEETGHVIEKNVGIIIPVYPLHYDPQYYPNPHKFDPERFSDENKSNLVPYTYLPFGDGPRRCIGERFALMVAKTGLVSIIKNFKVVNRPSTPTTIEYDQSSMFLHSKGPINLQFNKI